MSQFRPTHLYCAARTCVHSPGGGSGDFIGQGRLGNIKMGSGTRPVQFVRTPNGPVQTQTLYEFQVTEREKFEAPWRAVAGAKVNPWRNLLIVGNVLFGLQQFGLGHRSAVSFGAEYTF